MFLGQFLVALCFAELAASYPLAGGVYQWARRVGPGASPSLRVPSNHKPDPDQNLLTAHATAL